MIRKLRGSGISSSRHTMLTFNTRIAAEFYRHVPQDTLPIPFQHTVGQIEIHPVPPVFVEAFPQIPLRYGRPLQGYMTSPGHKLRLRAIRALP
jgi:hypothetical protein